MWIDPDLQLTHRIDTSKINLIQLEEKLRTHNWNKKNLIRPSANTDSSVIHYQFDNAPYTDMLERNAQMEYDDEDIKLRDLTLPFLSQLKYFYEGWKFVKGEISTFIGFGDQNFHRDPRVFHRFGHRVHIPLITNIDAKLCVGNNCWNLEQYGVYIFNNIKYHKAHNESNEMRIHIIIDIMPNDWWQTITGLYSEDELYSRCDAITMDPAARIEEIKKLGKTDISLSNLLIQLGDKKRSNKKSLGFLGPGFFVRL
jgi:hypothetical protein